MKFDGLIVPFENINYHVPLYSLKIIFDNYGKSIDHKYYDNLENLEYQMYERKNSMYFDLNDILVLLMNAKDNVIATHHKHYKRLRNLILESNHTISVLEDII